MKVESVVIATIDVRERMRAIDETKIAQLAESIREVGLLSPVVCYSPDEQTMDMVAGAHRLAAAKQLGWEKIDAIILEGDELHAQLAEIDENLMRSELTATQQAEHLQRRKEIWEAMRERENKPDQLEQVSDGRKGGRGKTEFSSETAEVTGQSQPSINRATRRAREVCQQARDLIRNTKLDTGKYLDGLIKQNLTDEQQVEQVKEALEALADAERRTELAEEAKARKEAAKQLRAEARDECSNFLFEKLTAREWGRLIDMIERSGGTLSADALRNWEAPKAA